MEDKVLKEFEDIIYKAINEAYPTMSSDSFIEDNKIASNAIFKIVEQLKKYRNELKIIDEYLELIHFKICDYDGYYNEETKRGNIEALADLIQEADSLIKLASKRDTKEAVYFSLTNKVGVFNYQNILHEPVEGPKEEILDEEGSKTSD